MARRQIVWGAPRREGCGRSLAKDLPLLVGQVRGIFRPFRVGHRYDSFRSVAGNRRDVVPFFIDLVNSKTRS